MRPANILQRFQSLNVWRRQGERAPHKPLLVLLALGELVRGTTELRFVDVEPKLTELLKEFGPTRSSHHPEFPFWRLANDGVWQVAADRPMRNRGIKDDPLRTELRAANARGGFTPDVLGAFRVSPSLIGAVAREMLESHFPDTLHEDILAAVGLSLDFESSTRRRRDSNFRNAVLEAYEFRCALCELDLRIGAMSIALEAAHVKWHQAMGPDSVDNGVCFCCLHHKLFDYGAFTFDDSRTVLVSEKVHGTAQFEEALLRHHGRLLRAPVRPEHRPKPAFVQWHWSEVFKKEPRPTSTAG